MAAMTPTTAQPRPLYKSVLAPALDEPEEADDDDELDEALLLLELVAEEELVLALLVPFTASQISETTLLVAIITKKEISFTMIPLCFPLFSVWWIKHVDRLTANGGHRARGRKARRGVGADGSLVLALARVVRGTAVGGGGTLVQALGCTCGDLGRQAGDVGGGGRGGDGQADEGGEGDGSELHFEGLVVEMWVGR